MSGTLSKLQKCLHNDLTKNLGSSLLQGSTGRPNISRNQYINGGPYTYKCCEQYNNFLKRVIMPTDKPFTELSAECFANFVRDQASFGIKQRSVRSIRVLGRARQIVDDILGDFDFHEYSTLCAFARKSTSTIPLRNSYYDTKLDECAGTLKQQQVFDAIRCTDVHLCRFTRKSTRELTNVITLKAVPKTYKSVRIIAPDTTLGGFLSRGLGSLLRKKLEEGTHINLAKAQFRHKVLVERASISGYEATIDMSKASDSFTWEHIKELVPISWHWIFDVCRTPLIEVPGYEPSTYTSFMLMGSGHTFPLQTILFYALAKATTELLGYNVKVSVYGDDIILPAKTALQFSMVMDDLGFCINTEKSCFSGSLRESCGADFFKGVSVRPFMPEIDTTQNLPYLGYIAELHKLYNGILDKWDYCEVQSFCDHILLEILRVEGDLVCVPNHEPSTSGLHYVPSMYSHTIRQNQRRHGTVRYPKLATRGQKRTVMNANAYYWYSLFNKQDVPNDIHHNHPQHPLSDSCTASLTWNKRKKCEEVTQKGVCRYVWRK